MKIRVMMKDPDAMHEEVTRQVRDSLAEIQGISEDERETLLEQRVEEQKEKLKKWFKYEEYLTVECDTEAGTATVIPA